MPAVVAEESPPPFAVSFDVLRMMPFVSVVILFDTPVDRVIVETALFPVPVCRRIFPALEDEADVPAEPVVTVKFPPTDALLLKLLPVPVVKLIAPPAAPPDAPVNAFEAVKFIAFPAREVVEPTGDDDPRVRGWSVAPRISVMTP